MGFLLNLDDDLRHASDVACVGGSQLVENEQAHDKARHPSREDRIVLRRGRARHAEVIVVEPAPEAWRAGAAEGAPHGGRPARRVQDAGVLACAKSFA